MILFKENTFLNPVLYAEYEQKQPALMRRRDRQRRSTNSRRNSFWAMTSRIALTVAANWINELKFDNGLWSFGYATGLNYALFIAEGGEPAEEEAERRRFDASWDLQKLTLGVEFYGGAGDSKLRLTLDPQKTEQYAVNLETNSRTGWFRGCHERDDLIDLMRPGQRWRYDRYSTQNLAMEKCP